MESPWRMKIYFIAACVEWGSKALALGWDSVERRWPKMSQRLSKRFCAHGSPTWWWVLAWWMLRWSMSCLQWHLWPPEQADPSSCVFSRVSCHVLLYHSDATQNRRWFLQRFLWIYFIKFTFTDPSNNRVFTNNFRCCCVVLWAYFATAVSLNLLY